MHNIVARSRNHCCTGNATMCSVCNTGLHVSVNNIKIWSTAQHCLCGEFRFAGNSVTYFGLHVSCPIFLSDWNKIWNFLGRFFHKPIKYQIPRKSVQWESRWYMRIGRRKCQGIVNSLPIAIFTKTKLRHLPFGVPRQLQDRCNVRYVALPRQPTLLVGRHCTGNIAILARWA